MTHSNRKEHHTIEKFHVALDLNDAGWARLRLLAKKRCSFKRPGEEDDVLQEAITRALEGRRPWPKGVNLFAFLSGVMQSIVSERVEKSKRAPSEVSLDAVGGAPTLETSAVGKVFGGEVVIHLMALFDGDDDAQIILEGRFEDMERSDLVNLLGDDETRYTTVCKRIRRRINLHTPKLEALIHGE